MITLEIKDVSSLLDRLDTLTEEIRRMSAHHRIIVSTIQEHGAVIERLAAAHERLRFYCPMFELEKTQKSTVTGNGSDKRGSSPHVYAKLDEATKEGED